MTVLADHELRAALESGNLVVKDFDPELIRPAAVSLRLGGEAFALVSRQPVDIDDAATYPELVPRPLDARRRLVLRPGEVLLVRTHERVGLSTRLSGLLDGTSDLARLGITVVLAHQVSPGWGWPDGAVLTLEIASRLAHDVLLRPGMRIANLLVFRGASADRSYGDMPAHHPTEGWSVASRLSAAEVTRRTP
jgi:dCTP deaminase